MQTRWLRNNQNLSQSQAAYDAMLPDDDMPEIDGTECKHVMERQDDVVCGHDCEYEAEMWYCTKCEHYEKRNERKVK